MSDQSWDEQVKKFLQQTSEDFRRAGKDIKAEAQRLLEGAMDPAEQQKIRNRLNELGAWARKAAHEVAGAVGEAANKAESALQTAAVKVTDKVSELKGASPSSTASPAANGAHRPVAASKPSRAKSKSGKKKGAAKRKR